jgi:CRP/FNR family transcriptional regulator
MREPIKAGPAVDPCFPRRQQTSGHVTPLHACSTCDVRTRAICAPLDPDELARVERLVVPMQLDANATLVHEGDPVDRVYTVTRGMLRQARYLADGRRQITGFLSPGDFLGLARGGTHHSTVEAVSEAEVCSMSRANLEEVFTRIPRLKDRLLALAADSLKRAEESQVSLGRRNPLEKVAAFLVGMAERMESAGLAADPLRLPMTRADIADYLGLTIETVSRSFTKLRQDGLIRLPASHLVELRSRARLEQLAGRS